MMISDNWMGIIISLGLCVFLPIVIVWLVMRKKTNETNKRTEILLAAIEKNADIDTESISKMLVEKTKKKSVKRTLLNRLLIGCIASFIGLALIGTGTFKYMVSEESMLMDICLIRGVVCLAIGIAFLLNYFVGKRFLAKEIEREENNLPEEE